MKKEKEKVEKQLSALNLALSAFVGSYYGAKPTPISKRRKISAAWPEENRSRAAGQVGED
jgi:hypothetical protein